MTKIDWQVNRLKYLDIGIIAVSVIISLLIYTQYPENTIIKYIVVVAFAAVGTYYAVQLKKNAYPQPVVPTPVKNGITSIVMLSETGAAIKKWDIQNKISLIIGKRTNKNEIGIDLSESTYEALIHNEHAVLNFACGNWYLEGLHLPTGISVKKAKDQTRYRLSSQKPCKIEPGDVIYIANTRLLTK